MDPHVTQLLRRAADGDTSASEELFSAVYDDLRLRAARLMQGPGAHTLQPTAVVNEAWLRLSSGMSDLESRRHFLAVAARAMRSVLVDHARSKNAQKRGGGASRLELDATVEVFEQRSGDLVELDDALAQLESMDPQLAKLVELRFFGGRTIAETAEVLSISTATVERHWRTARSWLHAELSGRDENEG